LDSSFLIAFDRETARGEDGPAKRLMTRLRGRRLVVSVISVEEILEGAADQTAALTSLQRFALQGVHLAQARRCALLQRRASRRMGENDAWLVATAQSLDADLAGADRKAFERLGERYLRFR
jgi:predicted nucleic acid-binding protein